MLFKESNESHIKEREDFFYKNIIRLYLRYGSVDEVFRATNYNLPISYPGMHHLIDRWGIIKSVSGPSSKLSEALAFLTLLSDKKIPLETLHKYLPPSFQISKPTMHRILNYIKEGVTRRFGTALVITREGDEGRVLIGEDITPPRIKVGKPYGAVTLPMTYSRGKENKSISILRVLQQEVFTELAVEKKMPQELIPINPQSFMHIKIADVAVSVFRLVIPEKIMEGLEFSSFKVRNHTFVPVEKIINSNQIVRSGVKEITKGYINYLDNKSQYSEIISDLNLALAASFIKMEPN